MYCVLGVRRNPSAGGVEALSLACEQLRAQSSNMADKKFQRCSNPSTYRYLHSEACEGLETDCRPYQLNLQRPASECASGAAAATTAVAPCMSCTGPMQAGLHCRLSTMHFKQSVSPAQRHRRSAAESSPRRHAYAHNRRRFGTRCCKASTVAGVDDRSADGSVSLRSCAACACTAAQPRASCKCGWKPGMVQRCGCGGLTPEPPFNLAGLQLSPAAP